RYSYRVASVVGIWLARLVGVSDPEALRRAAEMGLAMQLTNILRDVGEDRARGRLYLPLDVLARHGIDPEALMAGRPGDPPPPGWAGAMEELMAAAEARYARALEALPALPPFFRRPVGVSALVYRDIHRSLRRNGYDNLNRRAYVTRARKVWLGFRARLLLATGTWGGSSAIEAGVPETPAPSRARRAWRWAIAIGLALPCLVVGASFSGGQDAGNMGDAETTARRELAMTEKALRENPAGPGLADLLMRRLRLLHALSVQDERLLAPARAARAEAEAALGASPLLLAYRGALEVVEARHGFWPRERLEPLKRGLPLLDSAVRLDPDQAEIRYLRLTSGYYLPFFLGRKPQVREDFAALSRLLPGVSRDFPPAWYAAVTGFVLDKGNLSPRDRERLRRARDAAAGGGLS
ncbi:MAG TPA: squalene/phytoene synthase family protein, partial [Fibrobacteria bacterium]|nr:squalene/phytoene synthase family protein [Fibrobacteria bacterium]